MTWYILKDRKPVEAEALEAAAFFESPDRIVGRTVVNGYTVSTVFLGLDHSFGREGPVLFESMVFGPTDSQSEDMMRYRTWEEAEDGHHRLVAALCNRVGAILPDETKLRLEPPTS